MFKEVIKHLRAECGETQQQFGDRVGASQRTVASWEAGERMPSYDALLRIASQFNVSTDYLLGLVDLPTGHVYKDGDMQIYSRDSNISQSEKEHLIRLAKVSAESLNEVPDQVEITSATIDRIVQLVTERVLKEIKENKTD